MESVYPTLLDKIKDEGHVSGVGGPLVLFSETFKPTINVHDAVEKGMGKDWKLRKMLQPTIEGHLENTETVKEMMSLYDISHDECGAIVYYTCDARKIGGKREDSPFFQLNSAMAKRNFIHLEYWKEFLYFFLSGLQKVPNAKERVFRALDQPISDLSKQYKVGNTVVWVSFTSTSKEFSIAKQFMDTESKGTIMSIDVIEGKDISRFSLYPEKELLLLPNSSFEVKEITSSHMKNLLNIPSSMDTVILAQKQTPPHLLLMKLPDSAVAELRKKWEEYMQKKIDELNKQWEDKLNREKVEKQNIMKNYEILEKELKREQVERQDLVEKYKTLENELKRDQRERQNLENELKREQRERQNLENELKRDQVEGQNLEKDKIQCIKEQKNAKMIQNELKKDQVERQRFEENYKIHIKEQENAKMIQNELKREQVESQYLEEKKKQIQEIQWGQQYFSCQKCRGFFGFGGEEYFGYKWKKGDTVDCPHCCGNIFHFI